MNIRLVEDEQKLAGVVRKGLDKQGFAHNDDSHTICFEIQLHQDSRPVAGRSCTARRFDIMMPE